ncbi:MAG: hypothetical protein HC842_08050 [Cytophagales bacterium]|nr:hypothetical protein [Cytophagales bacterium]
MLISIRYRFLLVALLMVLGALAQSPSSLLREPGKELAALRLADSYFVNRQYVKALPFYAKAVKENPLSAQANFQLAECYRLLFDYQAAWPYYKQVAQAQDPDYKQARYYQALMEKLMGRLDQAQESFHQFLKEMNAVDSANWPDKAHWQTRTHVELAGCQMALRKLGQPRSDYEFKLLPPPINSSYNDYAAAAFGADSLLVITSGRPESKGNLVDYLYGEDFTDFFWFAAQRGRWRAHQADDGFRWLNTRFGEGSGCFTADRRRFYYTACRQGRCQIYVTRYDTAQRRWAEAQVLNAFVNDPRGSARHPALSPTGDTLFFASDRPGV